MVMFHHSCIDIPDSLFVCGGTCRDMGKTIRLSFCCAKVWKT
jgi:hypothetical protein